MQIPRAVRALGAGTCAALLGISGRTQSQLVADQEAAEPALFRFGVVADIQYCDCDDATNFAGTETRRYRGTLAQIHDAVTLWNGLRRDAGLSFVIQLGDLIDGQNAGKYGAGLGFMSSGAGPQSEVALKRVASELARCESPIYHAVGNHELYNFDWAGLRQRLQIPSLGWKIAPSEPADSAAAFGGFSWQPVAGWTFVMLNAYNTSIEQPTGLPGHSAAASILAEHNPKCYEAVRQGKVGADYFSGLEESQMRYVPFNGGLGEDQLEWLRSELLAAKGRSDRVVVMSHLPLYPPAASPRTLMYDADEAMEIFRETGVVVAVFAGHLHRGGYAVDDNGVHHVTVHSPLNFDECYGYCAVFDDRIELHGGAGLPSRTMQLRPPAGPAGSGTKE